MRVGRTWPNILIYSIGQLGQRLPWVDCQRHHIDLVCGSPWDPNLTTYLVIISLVGFGITEQATTEDKIEHYAIAILAKQLEEFLPDGTFQFFDVGIGIMRC